MLDPASRQHPKASLESGPAADHRLLQDLDEVPETRVFDNGFKAQWEDYLRYVVEDAPWNFTLREGAKGVQLAELAHKSWKERRWVDIPSLADTSVRKVA